MFQELTSNLPLPPQNTWASSEKTNPETDRAGKTAEKKFGSASTEESVKWEREIEKFIEAVESEHNSNGQETTQSAGSGSVNHDEVGKSAPILWRLADLLKAETSVTVADIENADDSGTLWVTSTVE